MGLHDDYRPLPLGDLFDLYNPRPWQEQCIAARDWLIQRWVRGAGEGTGNADLLADLRSRVDQAPTWGFYHVVALELLSVFRGGGDTALSALGANDLAEYFLKAEGIPAVAVQHYAERLA